MGLLLKKQFSASAKKGKKEIGRVGKGVGAGGDKGGPQGERELKREKGGEKGKGRFRYAPRDEKVISESATDKVRSSRETVALVTEVAQSGGQQCCVRAVHLHGEAGV